MNEKNLEDMTADEIDAEIKEHLVTKATAFREENAKAEVLRLEQEETAKVEADEAKQLEHDESFAKQYGLDKIQTPEIKTGVPNSGAKNTQNNTPEEGKPFFEKSGGIMKEIPSQVEFYQACSKLHGYDKNYVEYGSLDFLHGKENSYGFVHSDSGCQDNVAAWSPADIWCDLIWQATMCGRQLAGIVTLRACDINPGDGLSVQIRAINRSELTTTGLGACHCATCTSNVFTTYTITLDRLDEYKVLCHLDLWDAGFEVRDAVITSMANQFTVGLDLRIYTALTQLGSAGITEVGGASFICDPGFSSLGPTCCSYAANLYREVIQLESRMRANGYGPEFYLILHPQMANHLKYKEGISPPAWMWNAIHMDGTQLSKIGNHISVIEYCGGNPCTDAGKNVGGDRLGIVGVLLDPKRAIGEAYGYKPKFMADEDPIECDSTKLVYRTYVGIDVLDTNAIGHIVNP